MKIQIKYSAFHNSYLKNIRKQHYYLASEGMQIYVVSDFDFQPILFSLLKPKGVQNFLFGGYLGKLKTPKKRKNLRKIFRFLRVPPPFGTTSRRKSKSVTTYITLNIRHYSIQEPCFG